MNKRLKRISGSAFIVLILFSFACSVPKARRSAPQIASIEPWELRQSVAITEKFAGSERCRACHQRIYSVWEMTSHANVLSGEQRLSPPHQGSCDRCHTTAATENRVGCEACHGPAAVHADTQELAQSTDCRLCDIRKKCIQCHNRSIDPGFDAVDDWKIINHGQNIP